MAAERGAGVGGGSSRNVKKPSPKVVETWRQAGAPNKRRPGGDMANNEPSPQGFNATVNGPVVKPGASAAWQAASSYNPYGNYNNPFGGPTTNAGIAGAPYGVPKTTQPTQTKAPNPQGFNAAVNNNPWRRPAGDSRIPAFTSNVPVGYGSQYPGVTSAQAGTNPYTFFMNTPILPQKPIAPPKPKGGGTSKGWGKRGGGGGGGGWESGGGSEYAPSAWASLVGWNINR